MPVPPVPATARLVCAGSVFLAALLLYVRTLAPTVTLVDSGELIVAASCAGVPHPPGFPLWVVLANLAAHVPLGGVAVRVNFASALCAALACGVLVLAVTELMIATRRSMKSGPGGNRTVRGEAASDDRIAGWSSADGTSMRLLVLAPAVACALLLAFSRTLWSFATIAEVYALNTLLIVTVIFCLLRWRRSGMETASSRDDSWLYAAAFLVGLGLGVHHVTVALTLPALAVFAGRTCGADLFANKNVLWAALLSVIALVAVYAYLPLAASRAPLLNWGNPQSLTRLWRHMTGWQYQAFLSVEPHALGSQLAGFARMALREFGPSGLPLALVLAMGGFAYAYKRDRTAFWFLAVLIGGNVAYGLCYEIAEDKDAYYLPTFLSLAIAAGFGLRWVLEIPRQNLRLASALLVALLPGVALAGNWRFNDRSRYFIAQDYVENILAGIAPGGLLLTQDWQVASPALYFREIEHRRRDVKVVDVHLLRRSWYFDYLKRAYPQLVARSERQISAFSAELSQWEDDPRACKNGPIRSERINAAFRGFLQALISSEGQIAPVYITSDLAAAGGGENEELKQWLRTNFQLVPRGLVFQLSRNRVFEDPGELHLETRGLADGTLKFEKDDVVKLKVLPVYTDMLVSRGRYLAFSHQYERAAAAYAQALALDPSLAVARRELNEGRNARE